MVTIDSGETFGRDQRTSSTNSGRNSSATRSHCNEHTFFKKIKQTVTEYCDWWMESVSNGNHFVGWAERNGFRAENRVRRAVHQVCRTVRHDSFRRTSRAAGQVPPGGSLTNLHKPITNGTKNNESIANQNNRKRKPKKKKNQTHFCFFLVDIK